MADTPSTSQVFLREDRRRKRQNSLHRDIDGGWAYWVLAGLHVGYLLFAGVSKGLGVLLPSLKEHFNTKTWLVGFIISLMMTVMDFSSLFAGVLSHWVSSRLIVMLSGASVAVGLVLASFAQNVTQLGIFLGLLTGIGYGFTIITLEIELARHFYQKYACANGIASTGTSVGLFVMAPLMQFLLDVYGWRGALFIFGGLSLHLVACGSLLRRQSHSLVDKSSRKYRPHETLVAQESMGDTDAGKPTRKRGLQTFRGLRVGYQKLATASDLAIFKKFSFCTVVLVACCIRFVFTAWTIYFVPHAQKMGFSEVQAALLVTVTAVGNFFGKAFHGLIIDRRLITRRTLIGSSTTVTAVILFLDPLMVTSASMGAGCLVNGVALGVSSSMIQVFLKKVVGVDRLGSSLGWTNMVTGFVRLGSGFFPGWIYDQTQSYRYAFVLIGCVSAVCPVALTIEYIVSKLTRRGSYDLTSDEMTLPMPGQNGVYRAQWDPEIHA